MVLARGANCTDVHLARLVAGVQKAGLDVHDICLASGSADVLVFLQAIQHMKRVMPLVELRFSTMQVVAAEAGTQDPERFSSIPR